MCRRSIIIFNLLTKHRMTVKNLINLAGQIVAEQSLKIAQPYLTKFGIKCVIECHAPSKKIMDVKLPSVRLSHL